MCVYDPKASQTQLMRTQKKHLKQGSQEEEKLLCLSKVELNVLCSAKEVFFHSSLQVIATLVAESTVSKKKGHFYVSPNIRRSQLFTVLAG